MENKPFISGAATSGDLKATTMRKSSSSLNRLREKMQRLLSLCTHIHFTSMSADTLQIANLVTDV